MASSSTPLPRDLALASPSSEPSRAAWLGWRALLIAALLTATAAGFAIGQTDAKELATQESGAELTRLLQFMAIVKTALALAVAALIGWRLTQPIGTGVALVYVASTAMMFVAPGLIWQMQHVAAGALLFHGGFIAALLVSALDGEGREALKHRFFPVKSCVRDHSKTAP